MNGCVAVRPSISEGINSWLEQNIDYIGDEIKDISDPEKIKEYVTLVVQNACNYVYDKQRENAKRQQADGIRIALENGIHFGRTKMEIPTEFDEVLDRYRKGELSSRRCGEILNVSHSTFLKWIKEVDNAG